MRNDFVFLILRTFLYEYVRFKQINRKDSQGVGVGWKVYSCVKILRCLFFIHSYVF